MCSTFCGILFHEIGKEVRRRSIRDCFKTPSSQAVSIRVPRIRIFLSSELSIVHLYNTNGLDDLGVADCISAVVLWLLGVDGHALPLQPSYALLCSFY